MASKIVVFGSCSVDFTTYAPRLPIPGETIHGSKFVTSYGGKGANQCVAAAKLAAETILVAKVGDDTWGRDYIKYMEELGVDATFMSITKNRGTGVAQINVSEAGENQIVIVGGANQLLSADDALSARDAIRDAAVLVCQLETPVDATIKAFQLCNGMKILNAAPAASDIDKELLSLTSVLCVNESEASVMTGKPVDTIQEVAFAILKLLECGCETVIITLGANGAAFATRNDRRPTHVRSNSTVTPIDTTGAGDAFIGTLAALLASGRNISTKDAIGASCYAASESVTKEGTQTSFLRMSHRDLAVEGYAADYIVI